MKDKTAVVLASLALAFTAGAALAQPAPPTAARAKAAFSVETTPIGELLADPAAAANCTDNPHPNLDGWTGKFTGNNVNIRTGPHTSCTSLGQGLLGDTAVYFCWVPGDWVYNMASWTYVYDTRNRVSGWVSDYYLSDGGAYSVCPY